MNNRIKAIGTTIKNVGFNLEAQDTFVKQRGIKLEHWVAAPSPIGMKDRGEYRRSDALDTISSNGFIYTKVGEFTGLIVSNSKNDSDIEGGLFEHSGARLILPRFYDTMCDKSCKNKEISLLPGDRVYAKDVELKVANYQRADYNPNGVDFLQFPVKNVQFLMDSFGNKYSQGKDFKVDKEGNIKWVAGKKNPGIDPDTGKGRVYSIRYEYLAFWYVDAIINEIRITNEGDSGTPSRMAYHASIQREYVYHNRVKPDVTDVNKDKEDSRTNEAPKEKLDPNEYQVKVNMSIYED